MCNKHKHKLKNNGDVITTSEWFNLLCNTCLCHFALWSILDLGWNFGFSGFWNTLPQHAAHKIDFNNPWKLFYSITRHIKQWKHDPRAEFICYLFVLCAELAQLRTSLNIRQISFSETRRYKKIPSLSFSDITHPLLQLIYTACKTSFTTRVSRLYSAQKSGTPSAAAGAICQLNTEKTLK